MLAAKNLPSEFTTWNLKHKAPCGADWWVKFVNSQIQGHNFAWRNRYNLPSWLIRKIGPFGFQLNSLTRTFEAPILDH